MLVKSTELNLKKKSCIRETQISRRVRIVAPVPKINCIWGRGGGGGERGGRGGGEGGGAKGGGNGAGQ